jgi:hypothetical protein
MSHSVLLVGLGRIGVGFDIGLDGQKHISTHARAFSLHPKFQLIGGVDPDLQSRQMFERNYQCKAFLTWFLLCNN